MEAQEPAEVYTADALADFSAGKYQFTGYAGYGVITGADYEIAGFAVEDPLLINPALKLDVTAEGRVFYGGIDITNRPSVQEWLNQEIGQPGYYRSYNALTVELSGITMEGRSSFMGMVPNLGVPELGGDFGVFINAPADVIEYGGIDYSQIGLKIEGKIGSYYLVDDVFLDNRRIGVSVSGLAGIHVSRSDTQISHALMANFPVFGVNGDLNASYLSDIEDSAIIPYVGLAIDKDIPMENGAVLSAGLAVRGGLSVNNWDFNDHLLASGIGGAVDRSSSFSNSGTDTSFYGSISAQAALNCANGWSLQLGGGVQHGLVRSPNIYRPDSVEVSPGVFETANPEITFDPQTTFQGTIRLAKSF